MTKKTKTVEGEVLKKERKTRYKPSMCQKIIDVGSAGLGVSHMCLAIGVASRDTFYRWLREYPEFEEAYKEAKTRAQAKLEEVGFMGMTGQLKGFNAKTWEITMCNKFPDDYKRTANGSNTEINIGSINSIEQMDSKSLDAKIQQLQEKLGLTSSKEEDSNDTES